MVYVAGPQRAMSNCSAGIIQRSDTTGRGWKRGALPRPTGRRQGSSFSGPGFRHRLAHPCACKSLARRGSPRWNGPYPQRSLNRRTLKRSAMPGVRMHQSHEVGRGLDEDDEPEVAPRSLALYTDAIRACLSTVVVESGNSAANLVGPDPDDKTRGVIRDPEPVEEASRFHHRDIPPLSRKI